jgi:symplekin
MPKMVGILCNKPAEREMVRQVFRHVVSPVLDLSQSTNVAREKTADLTAADLLVLLHDQEKEIGLKAAIEGEAVPAFKCGDDPRLTHLRFVAIDICFGLTDLFTSEVFAVFMQRIIDGTTLPVLFMRTVSCSPPEYQTLRSLTTTHLLQVIRAVSTYRSLGGYVSTTLFSRLITKKIWTNSQLWKGFMHCAKLIAPQSFNALLQLPREQLKDLVNNQAAIKPALWQFVVSKAGAAKAQSYADVSANGGIAPAVSDIQTSSLSSTPDLWRHGNERSASSVKPTPGDPYHVISTLSVYDRFHGCFSYNMSWVNLSLDQEITQPVHNRGLSLALV